MSTEAISTRSLKSYPAYLVLHAKRFVNMTFHKIYDATLMMMNCLYLQLHILRSPLNTAIDHVAVL